MVSTDEIQTTNGTERVGGHGRGIRIDRRRLHVTKRHKTRIDTVDERLKCRNIGDAGFFGYRGLVIAQVIAVACQTTNGIERVDGHAGRIIVRRRKLHSTEGVDAGIDAVNQHLQCCH
ncbi:hypothetical protein, partial [Photobacterium leiognathi]|uniref:hypothetical protein n=1 Tax=Photobacterium leiognathi TaxID=553611 RepID=UPI001C632B71